MNAQAVALGAASVKSYLGQPLRAEIEVPEISSEEAASFKVAVASREAFQAAGVEYNQAMAGVHVSLHRRTNGESYLRIEGNDPVNEPFLGLVIDAEWGNGGHIGRVYTMLVDPVPGPSQSKPVSPPQATQVNRPAQGPAVPPPAEARPPHHHAVPAAADGGNDGQVTVKRGDTAMGIVTAHPIEGVSLDQMLIALLRANPNAFIHGNVNLVKTGAVLNMPTAEQAGATAPQAARRDFIAQVHAFNEYRTGVAHNVRNAAAEPAGHQAGGTVKPIIQESSAPAHSGDRLVLPPVGGSPKGAATAVAQGREKQAQQDRQAELKRTHDELNAIKIAASQSTPSTSSTSAASAPGVQVPISGTAVAPQPPASVAPPAPIPIPAPVASTPAPEASGAQPVAPASEPAVPAQVQPKPRFAPPPPPPPAEPSFIAQLSDNAIPLFGGLVVLLLIIFGLYRWKQGKKKSTPPVDSSYMESRLQPDSFFGASGGQHVNTREAGGTAGTGSSSLAYSPSQLDAAGDIDPVAEADVYLAYGRDQQAEEILKEALRSHAGRVAIHRKLAEIYAKRRDPRALQAIAAEAFDLTHGSGPDWQAIAALGNELDAGNPLYAPPGSAPALAPVAPVRGNFGADTEPQAVAALDNPHSSANVPQAAKPNLSDTSPRGGRWDAPPTMPMPAKPTPDTAPVDLDLGMNFTPPPEPAPAPARSQAAAAPVVAAAAAAAAATAGGKPGMIEFDLGALSTGPDSRSAELQQTRQPPEADDDPIGTKLALAQEFNAIGDKDGARSLVKEVIAEATGSLKSRAERFLAELS